MVVQRLCTLRCRKAQRPGQLGDGKRDSIVGTLRLLEPESLPERQDGEIYSCAYTPDSAFVLSGGWDGKLRLWDVVTGSPVLELSASPKPLSCCAISPDGHQWLTGSMAGLLGLWDGVSQHLIENFVAHTRPI